MSAQLRSSTHRVNYVSGLPDNGLGQALAATLGNGVVLNNTYASLAARRTAPLATRGVNTCLSFASAYDPAGTITQLTDHTRSEVSTYAYDALDRLLAVTMTSAAVTKRQRLYPYASVGNLTSMTQWPAFDLTNYATNLAGSAVLGGGGQRTGVTSFVGGSGRPPHTGGGGRPSPRPRRRCGPRVPTPRAPPSMCMP